MLNRVILIGHLANDPELKYTPSGHAVTTFRVAVSRPFTNAQGERETDFIDIGAWRQAAEFAANYLGKGRLVAVEGRIQVRSYETQEGQRRRVYEVVCDNLKALGRAPEHGGGDRQLAAAGAPSGGGGASISDEPPAYDDPFQDE